MYPLFQPPDQDQPNGKHCHLLPQSFIITLKDTSSVYQEKNISIDPIIFSSLHDFKIFSQSCIFHHGREKYSNSWCCDKWKMDLQVKKLKVDISTTHSQNSVPCPYHDPQCREKLLIPQVKGEDYENLFQNVLLKSIFIKHVIEEYTFCWKVLLVTLSKNVVIAITEFLSLFVNVIINIYIQ